MHTPYLLFTGALPSMIVADDDCHGLPQLIATACLPMGDRHELIAGNGVWAIACIEHTLTSAHWTDPLWETPARSGNTIAAAVRRWLDGGAEVRLEDCERFLGCRNIIIGCEHAV